MKRFYVSMLLVVAAVVLGSGVANAASDQVVFKVSHFLPPNHEFHKFIVSWCDKINKESDDKLKCQIYPSLQLGGTPAQLFDQAVDGVADIVWTVPTYQAGRFTKTEVFELPFMIKSADTASPAVWEYIQRNALDEFKGVKMLAAYVTDGVQLHIGRKPVQTLEDLKGLKIRAPGRLPTKILAALGAVPVQMPAPAVSEAISKKVVDGAALPWEATTPFKLQEICKTHTETPANRAKLSNTSLAFVMNAAKYNGLSPELKAVIDRNSGLELSKLMGKVSHGTTLPARNIAIDRRNSITVLSEAEYQRWIKATAHVNEDWIKEIASKGGNGKALITDAEALLKKYND